MTSRAWSLLAALVVLLVVAGPLVHDSTRSERVRDDVRIAGVDVGGLSVDEARVVVREQVARPARRDVVVRHEGETWTLGAERAEVEIDVEGTVAEAVRSGRGGNPWSRTWRDITGASGEADVRPRPRFDEAAVGAFVKSIGDEVDERATNADIDPNGGRLTVIEDAPGWRTDRDELLRRVTTVLSDPDSRRTISVPAEQLEPRRTVAALRESVPLYLVVDRSGFRLRVYEDLEETRTYSVSVGRAGHETPSGRYEITSKDENPAWHVPDQPWAGDKRGKVIAPDDPENPLESRWLGIEDGVGIHGTSETDSIGERASHGCIRMRVPEVEELYEQVPVGTPVYID